MATRARFARIPVAAAGVLVASAVAALPFVTPVPSQGRVEPIPNVMVMPPAEKGDRPRMIFDGCGTAEGRAACADIYGAAGGRPATIVVARRIDGATSVLVRFQAPGVLGR